MGLAKKVDEDALAVAFRPVIEQHGLVLESLSGQRVGEQVKVTVTVDLPEDEIGSVDLDTVTDVSRALSELADADESLLGTGPSTLDVTTPGVFRPLAELRHFKRVRSRLLDVTDSAGRTFLGRLREVEGDELIFDVQPPRHTKKSGKAKAEKQDTVPEGEYRLAFGDVHAAEIHLEFR